MDKEKLRQILREGLANGTVKIEIIQQCSWCQQIFHSDQEYEGHLVDGKTIDPKTGKLIISNADSRD